MPRRLVIFVGSPPAGRGGSPAWTGSIATSRDRRSDAGACVAVAGAVALAQGFGGVTTAADLVTSCDIQRNQAREEEENNGGDHDPTAPGPADLPSDCFAADGGAQDQWRWGDGEAGVVMSAFLGRHEQERSTDLWRRCTGWPGNDEYYKYPRSFVSERAIGPVMRTVAVTCAHPSARRPRRCRTDQTEIDRRGPSRGHLVLHPPPTHSPSPVPNSRSGARASQLQGCRDTRPFLRLMQRHSRQGSNSGPICFGIPLMDERADWLLGRPTTAASRTSNDGPPGMP